MSYTAEDFFKDVTDEAIAIRENAKPEEIRRLNIEHFEPESRSGCIYGQMTGGCRSQRAIELITKCCKRFAHNPDQDYDLDEILLRVNGETSPLPNSVQYLSSIEAYIMLPNAKNEELIHFLKGKSNSLF